MKKNKVVIYTAIAGGKDSLVQHKYRSSGFDYVCFSDHSIEESGMWEVRIMKKSFFDNVRRAKYYKLFPDDFFSQYKYSVWIDANVNVLSDALEKRIYELIENNSLMAVSIHPHRNCAYEEANACIEMKKDDPDVILRLVDYMKSNGFPRDLGLYALMIIYRQHHDTQVKQLMKKWWWMIERFSRRDQISFMYVLFKSKMKIDVLFEQDIYSDPAFSFVKHSIAFYSKLMVDSGDGFNYKDMFIEQFITNGNSQIEMEFYLDYIHVVKRIRYFPFDTGVGNVRLISIKWQGSDGVDNYIDLKKIQSNGELLSDGSLSFKTFTPFIEVILDDYVKKIIISGVFRIESENVSRQLISSELENNKTSLIKKYLRLMIVAMRKSGLFRVQN